MATARQAWAEETGGVHPMPEWYEEMHDGLLAPFWMFGQMTYEDYYYLPQAHLTGYDRVAGLISEDA